MHQNIKQSCFAVLAGVIAMVVPVYAHHGTGVSYDASHPVTMKGVVTEFHYANPHPQLYFDVTDDKGHVEHWVAETTNPAMLNRVGWSNETLTPGDQVTLFVNPNRVGAKVTFLEKVQLADGKELTTQKAF